MLAEIIPSPSCYYKVLYTCVYIYIYMYVCSYGCYAVVGKHAKILFLNILMHMYVCRYAWMELHIEMHCVLISFYMWNEIYIYCTYGLCHLIEHACIWSTVLYVTGCLQSMGFTKAFLYDCILSILYHYYCIFIGW